MNVDKLKPSEIIVQCVSALVIGFMALQTGFVLSWPSYNVANLLSNETVLATPMTSLHISLLGSLPNAGGLIAMPLCGWAFNNLGRKYGSMLLSIPFVILWSIIALTNKITLILLAFTIAGAGIAGQNVASVYLSEIAHISIRGAMTSSITTIFLIGILFSYIMGGHFAYKTVVMVNLILSVLTILLLALLPESPVFLVLVGKEEEASRALSFYRQRDAKSKQVKEEILKIRRTMKTNLEILLQDNEQDLKLADKLIEKLDISNGKKENNNMNAWQFLLKSKSSKHILVSILLTIAFSFSIGGSILQVFAEPLFAEAVPTMSSNQCAIFSATNGVIAGVVCMVMIDKYGRKSILVVTTAIAGICSGLLGVQLQVHYAPPWFTILLIYVYNFMFTAGCGVIPFVMSSEAFLPEVTSLCNSICYGFLWIVNFINLFMFNPLVESMGLAFIFYIFCLVAVTGTIYTYFYIPETKGLSVDTIQVIAAASDMRMSDSNRLKIHGVLPSRLVLGSPGNSSHMFSLLLLALT